MPTPVVKAMVMLDLSKRRHAVPGPDVSCLRQSLRDVGFIDSLGYDAGQRRQ